MNGELSELRLRAESVVNLVHTFLSRRTHLASTINQAVLNNADNGPSQQKTPRQWVGATGLHIASRNTYNTYNQGYNIHDDQCDKNTFIHFNLILVFKLYKDNKDN